MAWNESTAAKGQDGHLAGFVKASKQTSFRAEHRVKVGLSAQIDACMTTITLPRESRVNFAEQSLRSVRSFSPIFSLEQEQDWDGIAHG